MTAPMEQPFQTMKTFSNEHPVAVRVPHAGAPVQLGHRGIVLAVLPLQRDTDRPLLVVWDEGERNPGTSATNPMRELLAWAAAFWPLYRMDQATVLQRDSDGAFDEVLVNWSGDPPAPQQITWRPVLAAQALPRSWAAVQESLGAGRAAEIDAAVQAVAES